MSHETPPAGRGPGLSAEKLVYMANQIALFFEAQGIESAPAGIAEHLRLFWDRRMREAILAFAASGGTGLRDTARAAVAELARGGG